MIKFNLTGDNTIKRIAQKLDKQYRPILAERLKTAINLQAEALRSYVIKNKLSGQVLRRVTGTLSRSINVKLATVKSLTALVGVGTDAPYGKVHELGLIVKVPVTTKSRKYFWAMWYQTQQDKYKAMALTKDNAFTIHTKKRPFLLPSYEERYNKIQEAISDAVKQALVDIAKETKK